MSLSNYAETKVLDHIFRNCEATDFTDNDLYIGLATALSSDGASITEVSGGGYARQQICDHSAGTNSFAAASGNSITTDTQISFPEATAGQGTVTHVIIYDSLTGGNLIAWGSLSIAKQIDSGDTFIISSGNLTITLD